MACALTIVSGRGRGRRFPFDGEEVCIGRSPESDLVLNDGNVSRTHARIHRQAAQWVLVDCGSANGTELNGAKVISPAQLCKGDRIRVGAVVFKFEPEAFGQRGRIPIRLRLAVAAALLLVAAGYAALIHGRANRAAAAQAQAAAGLSWVPTDGPKAADGAAVTSSAEATPAAAPEAARAAYERGKRKLEERRIAPRNLYDAWSAFNEARRLLEGVSPEPPLRAELGRLIHDAEADLGRDCKRLLFAAARLQNYGETARAVQAYRDVLSRFPGDEPSGCRKTAQSRLSAAEENQ